jgi:hypothetical protein
MGIDLILCSWYDVSITELNYFGKIYYEQVNSIWREI